MTDIDRANKWLEPYGAVIQVQHARGDVTLYRLYGRGGLIHTMHGLSIDKPPRVKYILNHLCRIVAHRMQNNPYAALPFSEREVTGA